MQLLSMVLLFVFWGCTHDLKDQSFAYYCVLPVACINLWFCRQLLSSFFFCCSLSFLKPLLHMVQKRQVRKPTISAALSLLQNPISKLLFLCLFFPFSANKLEIKNFSFSFLYSIIEKWLFLCCKATINWYSKSSKIHGQMIQ